MSKDDIKGTVFTAHDVSKRTVQVVEDLQRQDTILIPTGLETLDSYFLPMRPGELVTVIGRPSNFKTGLMQYIARREALRIAADEKRRQKHYVAYVTWEQSVEEMTLLEIASTAELSATDIVRGNISPGDTQRILKAAVARTKIPMWIIGHSLTESRRRRRLTLDDVTNAIYYVEDNFGLRPSLIVLDYLQRIRPAKSYNNNRQAFIEMVDMSKDMALAVPSAVLLGCQAKRDVDDWPVNLPGAGSGQETSNVEHSSDGIMTVWMPKTTKPIGSTLPAYLDVAHPVHERMLLVSAAKRKMGPAGKVFNFYVIPEQNKIECQ